MRHAAAVLILGCLSSLVILLAGLRAEAQQDQAATTPTATPTPTLAEEPVTPRTTGKAQVQGSTMTARTPAAPLTEPEVSFQDGRLSVRAAELI